MKIIKDMQFYISYIFRKDNHRADKMAFIGFQQNEMFWMDYAPICILDCLNRNRLGFTEF
jgi:hypothetical protein